MYFQPSRRIDGVLARTVVVQRERARRPTRQQGVVEDGLEGRDVGAALASTGGEGVGAGDAERQDLADQEATIQKSAVARYEYQ